MRSFLVVLFASSFLLFAASESWADDTIAEGLTITIPSQGATNWYQTFKAAVEDISAHDHTGSGKGNQITSSAIASNALTGAKIRLQNDEYLRARNSTNSADVDILKIGSGNSCLVSPPTTFSSAVTMSTPLAVASGGTGGNSAEAARAGLGLGALSTLSSVGNSHLSEPVSVANGGTGATSASSARVALGAAASGANNDITALNGMTVSDWSPVLTFMGGGQIPNSIYLASYQRVGGYVFFSLVLSFRPPSLQVFPWLEVSLPASGVASPIEAAFPCTIWTSTGFMGCRWTIASNRLKVQLEEGSFGLGVDYYLSINSFYKAS